MHRNLHSHEFRMRSMQNQVLRVDLPGKYADLPERQIARSTTCFP